MKTLEPFPVLASRAVLASWTFIQVNSMQIKRMKITLGRKKLHQRVSWVNMYIKWQATRWTACKGPGSSYESILVVKIVVENRNGSYFSIRKRIIPIEINKQWSNKRNCRLFSVKWRDVFKFATTFELQEKHAFAHVKWVPRSCAFSRVIP